MQLCIFKQPHRQPFSSWSSQNFHKLRFLGKGFSNPSIRILALSLILSGLLGGTAYAHDPVLKGTLTIDFIGNQDEISQNPLDGDLKIMIPNQGRFAGLRIPKTIDGQPFRGQEFTVSLVPNGCVLDGGPNSGQALLRLSQKLRGQPPTGTVFKTHVSNGQYECLFGGASQVMPYDPFDGNNPASVIGELVILWTQVFSNPNISNGQSVEEEMQQFFEIPTSHAVHYLRFRSVEYPSAQGPQCNSDSKHLSCNRGGSADGIFNADIRLKFKEKEQELQ